MRERFSTREPRSRSAHSLALALSLAALFGFGMEGCQHEPQERREARAAVERFASALRAHDDSQLRALATCVVETGAVHDVRLRRMEPVRSIGRAALDSLSDLYAEAHRLADSIYVAAPDSAADLEHRFDRTRDLARRAEVTRSAIRAAEQSARDAPRAAADGGGRPNDGGELQTLRAHLMVRYAGDAVGPSPVDRDTIVRLLRAPGGPWVVFAFDFASDAPGPLPY